MLLLRKLDRASGGARTGYINTMTATGSTNGEHRGYADSPPPCATLHSCQSRLTHELRQFAARLTATHADFLAARPAGADEDVHMLPSIVDHVLERCSSPGDLVFDPFTGFGTTIERAVALGRSALGLVAAQCARLVKPGGFIVWNVADIHHMGTTTHLIRDCSRVLAKHLPEVQVTDIMWDRLPHDVVADALLVFQRPPTGNS